jgi:hypothetical protein
MMDGNVLPSNTKVSIDIRAEYERNPSQNDNIPGSLILIWSQ